MNTYISVLSTNDYLPGVLVVNKCLKLTKAKFPFTILITDNISSDTINILEKNNIKIKHIENLFLKNHKIDKWYYTFSKLCIFAQIEFENIVYIDLDMVITENLDHLFKKPYFSAVNAGGFIYKDWVGLNSGLMVFKPSINIYKELVRLLNDGTYYSSDQDIISKYYKGWSKKKEQNLGHEYNMFVSFISSAVKDFNFTTINSIEEINDKKKETNNIKVLHYIDPKPWFKSPRKQDKFYDIWHKIYDSIEIK